MHSLSQYGYIQHQASAYPQRTWVCTAKRIKNLNPAASSHQLNFKLIQHLFRISGALQSPMMIQPLEHTHLLIQAITTHRQFGADKDGDVLCKNNGNPMLIYNHPILEYFQNTQIVI
ncbi:Hypothetical_protein [Hexamita inflata]|uniref:Hypothetical_protein n=1 Tax=Hexamita inflata TaxID=28002 RepID=A0AA86QVL4_9EUKA|nr:Hypothetical protein HINF_LOCUS52603 [Hexamita inflata]